MRARSSGTNAGIGRSAVISACGRYRYRLERELRSDGPVAAWVMVNPSRADAKIDDQTIRKCLGFARSLAIGRLVIVNAFAYRAADIRELRRAHDPVGPDNDRHIEAALREADIHIAGWGPLAKLPPHLRGRWRVVLTLAARAGRRLQCLGVAKDGQPLHPLRLSYRRRLIPFDAGGTADDLRATACGSRR
jgi:hypothetical protein